MSQVSLPAGTVTFLFTDIEGSTRLLRELGDGYDAILDAHHAALREVWAHHRGAEVKTEGDSFLVAFGSAADALAAAVAGQAALAATVRVGERPLLVRMGVHCGYGRPTGRDYRSLAVHQAARVVDVANGGQILATTEALTAVEDPAELGLSITNLGHFRVRDFDDPISLHRVSGHGIESDTRPPRARPADRHNLVQPFTSLVGRVDERERLTAVLGRGALVTLVGPGGVGKTRLSIEAGFDVTDRWPDGVWFVDLAAASAGDVVPMEIAEAINAPSAVGNDAWTDVIEHIADLQMLLVLDNCEHVAEDVAHVARDVLQRAPGVGVLATSRVPLGLRGEVLFRLGPLGMEGPDSEAVALFLARAGLDGDRVLDADARNDVLQLCRAIDGLPLAIELAATRARALTPAEMLSRMRRSVSIVASGDPTLPDRQRSLDRVLDWTIELLSPAERTALTRLAVLHSGFDVSLAEAVGVGGDITLDAVPELVWSLLDWSLVEREAAAGGTRYALLSTVRSYALQRGDHREIEMARQRLVDTLRSRLGPDRPMSRAWVAQMGLDLENVRGVIDDEHTSDEAARSLAWAVGTYHDVRSNFRSGIAEVDRVIGRSDDPGPDLVALLTLSADLHLRLGEVTAAQQIVGRAADLSEHVGVPAWDDMGVIRTRGEIALRSNDPRTASQLAHDALSVGPSSTRSEARLWNLAAIAHHALGETRAACDALDHCLRAEEAAGLDTFLANTYGNYAEALLDLGDVDGAAQHQLHALDNARAMGQAVNIGFACMVAARFALEQGAVADAVRVQTGADAILDREGFSLYESDSRRRADLLDAARAGLSAAEYGRLCSEGGSTPLDQLADLAAEILRRRAALKGD